MARFAEADSVEMLLHLRIGSFDPVKEPLGGSGKDAGRYALVQMAEPPCEIQRTRLTEGGLVLLEYIPEWAYLVDAASADWERLRTTARIRWSGPFLPEYRFDPQLASRVEGATRPVLAILFSGADPEDSAERLRKMGCKVLGVQQTIPHPRVVFLEGGTPMEDVLELPDLLWLTEMVEVFTQNNDQAWVIQSNVPQRMRVWEKGLDGTGQIIGHIDHGPDQYHCLLLDPEDDPIGPNHRKIVANFSDQPTGTHGTHTAGAAVGRLADTRIGAFPDGSLNHAGIAYEARLAHDDFRRLMGTNDPNPGLYAMLQRLHGAGARVHTNSWGTGANPYYGYFCVDVDTFCRDRETDTVLFAAGNAGVIADPSVSKNCISVGATDASPNQDTVIFGGGGPTVDGRRKPDAFAVGRTISGYYSHCHMDPMQGTSMSTPALAGCAALIRQYYMEGYHVAGTSFQPVGVVPSGALVKATLVNSTVPMSQVENWPSDAESWGRVLLDNALFFAGDSGRLLIFDVLNGQGLNTGGQAEYAFDVPPGAESVRLTLAFTDAPASYRASSIPVNNLDLILVAPGENVYRGNVFSGGRSVPGGSGDPLNNVEQILLKSPTPGRYTARVHASAVNWGLQGYALVISGNVETAPDATPTPVRPTNTPLPPIPTWTPLRVCGNVVSQGKPAFANGHYLHYTPDRAVDGIVGSGESRWISVGTKIHWFYVDLGQPYDLCQIHVYSDEAYDPPDPNNRLFNISQYTLHGTNNPVGTPDTWPKLGSYFDGCGPPFPDYTGEGMEAHNAHSVTGTYRYVGIHVTGGDGWCNDCRLQEFRVFAESGLPGPTRTPTQTPTPMGRAGGIRVH